MQKFKSELTHVGCYGAWGILFVAATRQSAAIVIFP
jgi:hypothetical protein